MNFNDAVTNWKTLSSEGIVGEFFRVFEQLAKLAGNTHNLLGLL